MPCTVSWTPCVTEARRHRVFFALWPDDATRAALHRLAREMARRNGRAMAEENIHLTLAFIGNVDKAGRDCLLAAAAGISGEVFTLRLDACGFWARPRVAWVGPKRPPAALMALAGRLNRALEAACGWQPERRAFLPHVTLVRKAGRLVRPRVFEPIEWKVDSFCLVESHPTDKGVRYEPLRCWPLGAAGNAENPGPS
ncbi:MAG TPA: RNA 2',3'-cyclic phosphodiesterase [Thiotrichales bacterium]|nr:RNA 2',3'-cyclic phosphodiesterase [Thiotrichales bacterium]